MTSAVQSFREAAIWSTDLGASVSCSSGAAKMNIAEGTEEASGGRDNLGRKEQEREQKQAYLRTCCS